MVSVQSLLVVEGEVYQKGVSLQGNTVTAWIPNSLVTGKKTAVTASQSAGVLDTLSTLSSSLLVLVSLH